jgi:molybdopterin molybdotransferase
VFLPARLERSDRVTAVRPISSQGSGDLAAMARADCLLVIEPQLTTLAAGAFVPLLPK